MGAYYPALCVEVRMLLSYIHKASVHSHTEESRMSSNVQHYKVNKRCDDNQTSESERSLVSVSRSKRNEIMEKNHGQILRAANTGRLIAWSATRNAAIAQLMTRAKPWRFGKR